MVSNFFGYNLIDNKSLCRFRVFIYFHCVLFFFNRLCIRPLKLITFMNTLNITLLINASRIRIIGVRLPFSTRSSNWWVRNRSMTSITRHRCLSVGNLIINLRSLGFTIFVEWLFILFYLFGVGNELIKLIWIIFHTLS